MYTHSRAKKFSAMTVANPTWQQRLTSVAKRYCNSQLQMLNIPEISHEHDHPMPGSRHSPKQQAFMDQKIWDLQNVQLRSRRGKASLSGILKATSVQQIHEQLQVFRQQHTNDKSNPFADELRATDHLLPPAYSFAIQRCGLIQAFDEGFKIFHQAKQTLRVCPPRIFANAMRLTMQQDFSVNGLNKCVDIFTEMKAQYNTNPDGTVYKELIKNATALKQFNKAAELIEHVLHDTEHKAHCLKYRPLSTAIVNYYAKRKQIKQGLDFMQSLMEMHGTAAVGDAMYSSLLSGIAALIKDGKTDMIQAANSLFKQTFNNLTRPPKCDVFNAFLTCYANVPNVQVCINLLSKMTSKEEWPNPDGVTFAICLNSLVNDCKHRSANGEDMNYDQVWKHVDNILELRKDLSICNEICIYGPLFNLCSGFICNDMERLYMFYDEMEQKNLKLAPMTARSLLEAGMDHYKLQIAKSPTDIDEIKQDMQAFIAWTAQQFEKYDLPFHHDAVNEKMNNIASRTSLLRNNAAA